MDKKLELRLIERGYRPNPSEIDFEKAGNTLKSIISQIKDLNDNYHNKMTGLVFFEGLKDVYVKSEHKSTLKSAEVAIMGARNIRDLHPSTKSLQLYTLQDLMESEADMAGSARVDVHDDYFADVKSTPDWLSVRVKSKTGIWRTEKMHAEILITKQKGGGRFFYFEHAKVDEENRYFWECIASLMGLKLMTEDHSSGGEYTTKHDGIELKMSGRSITTRFPKKMPVDFLSQLVAGLSIELVEIDGIECKRYGKPCIPISGKELKVNIHGYYGINRGEATLGYFSRVLGSQPKP